MQHLSDKELVDLVMAGQAEAFGELLRRHKNLVQHMVGRMVANRADREDLGQEIFIRIYHNLSEFRFASKLSTWVAQIAHNTCLNYLQKKKVPLLEDLLITAEDTTSVFEQVAGWDKSPLDWTVDGDIARVLRNAIDLLPVHYRTVITLFHLEEMSYVEIGEIMQVPEGTVKSYLFRARKLLRQRLAQSNAVEAAVS